MSEVIPETLIVSPTLSMMASTLTVPAVNPPPDVVVAIPVTVRTSPTMNPDPPFIILISLVSS